MRVFITGATGFIGRALVPRLQRDGHSIVVWTRSAAQARARLGADVEIVSGDLSDLAVIGALRGCEGIVNLAGEPIVGKRWTAARRHQLEHSRVQLTESLVDAMAAANVRNSVLISGSAVGYYGDRADEVLTEASTPGDDFLGNLCVRWEWAARKAENLGSRVVLLRTGVVLGRGGGALAQMLPPFRLGVGGPIGSGRQYLPWIHLHDLAAIVAAALTDSSYWGPVNGVAPEEATGRVFAQALGRSLNRPAAIPVPALALKAIFGRAAIVLLGSQRIEPRELKARGFSWQFPTLQSALDDIVRERAASIVPRDGGDSPDARYELRARAVVNAPIDQTFAFFSSAENLGLLTPAAMKFAIEGTTPTMRTGSLIDHRITLGPVPIRWRTRIAEWEPGRAFVDTQDKGPYKYWRHSHAFEDSGPRTVMEDRVWYTPPLGLLGRIAHRFFIAPALRRIFQYRSDVIRLRFGCVLLALALSASAAHAAQAERPVETVSRVDLNRYVGEWFEIARLPNWFQKSCASDVRARYATRDDGRIDVVNACQKTDGQTTEARGLARVVDARTSAKLKVRFAPAVLSFLPMVWGDYWIVGLADDYRWAVVGSPDRKYLWILARTPSLDTTCVDEALAVARRQGFDTERLIRTTHTAPQHER